MAQLGLASLTLPFHWPPAHDTLMKTRFAPCLFLALLALTATAGLAQQKLPVTQLNVGIHLIQAEVAANDQQRATGLMFRKRMEKHEGMVFRFDEAGRVCMWMKNTLLPLSVAFMDDGGKILNIEDMQPQTLDAHCSNGPARYALEMNQGWFAEKNIRAGTTVGGLPK